MRPSRLRTGIYQGIFSLFRAAHTNSCSDQLQATNKQQHLKGCMHQNLWNFRDLAVSTIHTFLWPTRCKAEPQVFLEIPGAANLSPSHSKLKHRHAHAVVTAEVCHSAPKYPNAWTTQVITSPWWPAGLQCSAWAPQWLFYTKWQLHRCFLPAVTQRYTFRERYPCSQVGSWNLDCAGCISFVKMFLHQNTELFTKKKSRYRPA